MGEDYACPADPIWPFPLYSTHPEEGGLYAAGEFVTYRQTNPLHSQVVATRGITIVDNATNIPGFGVLPVPTFIGSNAVALSVHQVSGPNDYQPGFTTTLGWKFADGSAFEHPKAVYLTEVNLNASAASRSPQNFQEGARTSDEQLPVVPGLRLPQRLQRADEQDHFGRRHHGQLRARHLERRQHHDRAVSPAL